MSTHPRPPTCPRATARGRMSRHSTTAYLLPVADQPRTCHRIGRHSLQPGFFPMLDTVVPHAFIYVAIGICHGSLALSVAAHKLALVHITVGVAVSAESMHLIILHFTLVRLLNVTRFGSKDDGAPTLTEASRPGALVAVTISILNCSEAVACIFLPVSSVYVTFFCAADALAMPHVCEPFAL